MKLFHWRKRHNLTQKEAEKLLHFPAGGATQIDFCDMSPAIEMQCMFLDIMLCENVDKASVKMRKYWKQYNVKESGKL